MDEQKILIAELTKLLIGGGAHISLRDALKGLSPELRGVKPENMPYSIWQLVEHIRIAQWDMLQFCVDADHQSPEWPDGYWPAENGPHDEDTWKSSLQQISNELDEFIALLTHSNLYQTLPHGTGQNILREALQIADHNAYHTGEIIAIRRILNDYHRA
jgi:hypothetical protein